MRSVDKALGNPIKELLEPSAKILGEHWAQKLSHWLTPKETESVESHVEEARRFLTDNRLVEPTPRQIGALIEWTDYAKSIDAVEQPT